MRKSMLPVPANDALLNVPFKAMRLSQAPSSGDPSAGTCGMAVSSWKLCVALQPERFPAASCARACHWYVPSGSAAGVHEAVAPLETVPDVLDCRTGAQAVAAGAE